MEPTLFAPIMAQVGLTLVVLIYMYSRRLPAIMKVKGDPQEFNTPGAKDKLPESARFPADNLMNLFEIPVLFFALTIGLTVFGKVDAMTVQLAWAYVGLRALHSLIQCTYNKVMHRFLVYITSCFVLIFMWARVAIDLI